MDGLLIVCLCSRLKYVMSVLIAHLLWTRGTKPDIVCCRGILKSDTFEMKSLDPTVFIFTCHHVNFLFRSLTQTIVFFVSLQTALYLFYWSSLHCFAIFLSEAVMLLTDTDAWETVWVKCCAMSWDGHCHEKLLCPPKLRVRYYVQNNTVFESKITISQQLHHKHLCLDLCVILVTLFELYLSINKLKAEVAEEQKSPAQDCLLLTPAMCVLQLTFWLIVDGSRVVK